MCVFGSILARLTRFFTVCARGGNHGNRGIPVAIVPEATMLRLPALTTCYQLASHHDLFADWLPTVVKSESKQSSVWHAKVNATCCCWSRPARACVAACFASAAHAAHRKRKLTCAANQSPHKQQQYVHHLTALLFVCAGILLSIIRALFFLIVLSQRGIYALQTNLRSITIILRFVDPLCS